jgi:hypothetical protein
MKHLFSVAVLPALLAGCAATQTPEVSTFRNPADLSAEIRPFRHRSPLAYTARVPVEPKPWKKVNEGAAADEGDAS